MSTQHHPLSADGLLIVKIGSSLLIDQHGELKNGSGWRHWSLDWLNVRVL